jgi:hypothetical protein
MNADYRYETCRLKKRLDEVLDLYSDSGYRLFSAMMGDWSTR